MPISAASTLSCAGCGQRIFDKYALNVAERSWHDECLRCSACDCILKERCYQRDDKFFCVADFFKKYGIRCVGCDEVLMPQEMVRRVKEKHFHLHCLQCACCRKALATGEEFYIVEQSKFVCKSDYNSMHNKKSLGDVVHTVHNDTMDSERSDLYAEQCTAEQQDRTCSVDVGAELVKEFIVNAKSDRSEPDSDCDDSDHLDTESNVSGNSISEVMLDSGKNADKESSASNSGPNNSSNSPNSPANNNNNNPNGANAGAPGTKRRGPRTTIKAKQLETLKNAFSATPKPSRHIREQLASETGLNMRVIQVWFQNRRSKERRMKQLSAMGLNRRMLFNRGPRRLRALRAGMDPTDPMMAAMLAENGAPVAPNIDVSHHLSSLPAGQNAVRQYEYFAASEHTMPPEYMLMQHGMPHAPTFAEYYPSATCNAQVFMETGGLKSEVFNQ